MSEENKRLIRLISAVAVLVFLVTLGFSSVFTVKESEQAVITTFGKYTRTAEAGLNFKLPWPIQDATILPVNLNQKIELGYGMQADGEYYSIPDESMMITGDMNIVNIDFFIEWKISDPYKYLFVAENPDLILKNILQSSVRTVVGVKSIDEVLTVGKIQIQAEVRDMLHQRFEENDIGLMILDVKINDSEPPTESVAKAFRDVETAKQQKDTALNQSIEYRNREMPQANAEADQIIRSAEGAKQSHINEAIGERDRFLSLYNEYVNFPEITRTRMYLEAIENILPGVRVYIDDGTGVQTLLPLESLIGRTDDDQKQPVQPTPQPTPQPTDEADDIEADETQAEEVVQ